jgi:hypothetical protein
VADLVVVDGDPLDDPELLLDEARIWLVFQAGGVVAGAGLDSDLASLRSAVPGTDPVPALAGRPVG